MCWVADERSASAPSDSLQTAYSTVSAIDVDAPPPPASPGSRKAAAPRVPVQHALTKGDYGFGMNVSADCLIDSCVASHSTPSADSKECVLGVKDSRLNLHASTLTPTGSSLNTERGLASLVVTRPSWLVMLDMAKHE